MAGPGSSQLTDLVMSVGDELPRLIRRADQVLAGERCGFVGALCLWACR